MAYRQQLTVRMLSKVKLLTPLTTSSKPAERPMSVGEEEAEQAD